MKKFWILKEEMGFSYGLAETDKQLPEGAEVFENEKDYLKKVDSTFKQIEEEVLSFTDVELIDKKVEKELSKDIKRGNQNGKKTTGKTQPNKKRRN